MSQPVMGGTHWNRQNLIKRLNDKSRMRREFHVRFCESLKGRLLGATRPPTIYNNSYPLLTHIVLQSLISFIPFLPNINILTRGVRCLFRFPSLTKNGLDKPVHFIDNHYF